MNEKIYLHAINAQEIGYSSRETQLMLAKILKCGALLSLRKQKRGTNFGFSGIDYISLCDYEKRMLGQREDHLYNSFHGYISNSLSFVFPKDKIDVIEPIILDEICNKTKEGYRKMQKLGKSKNERYSDMPDEVQVKDKLLLKKNMSAMTFPTHKLMFTNETIDSTVNYIEYELNQIRYINDRYGINVPIFDINTLESLDSKENIKLVLTKL